jgi:alpha-ketoglutaric semialdehyde dehydrogenase
VAVPVAPSITSRISRAMATQTQRANPAADAGSANAGADRARNFIGGEWVEPASGRYFENRNPARQSDLIGLWPRSGREDVERAVAAAREGFERWRRTPAPERGAVLKRVGDLLTERKEEIARAATREMGKVLLETRGDVQEGIDTAYYAATEGRRLFGHTVPSELRDKWAMSFRRPIGVTGLITPFNFPLAIPTWKMFPALVCGNSVILKPAEDVPHTATLLVEVLEEAGIPAGVVNLLHGLGDEVGAELVRHPGVPVISFTGSTETGSAIGRVCGEMHKRLSLEMGGKNAQIVMPDADMDLALDGVLWGAFGTTGQRCTATSRLLLHEEIHDRFVERLADQASRLRLGFGVEDGVQVGPLIHAAARDKVESYMDVGREEGAQLVCGGGRPGGADVDDGFFFQPTIFAGVKPGSRLATEEIFGPVLSVIRFGDLDEAFRINNEVRYGLSSSLYTRDVNASFRAMTELDNGITYVNAPTIGAEAHLPFGGVKQTGNGHREGGWEVYEFYSETKVGYVDFSGKLQRAQIDNYDAGPY